MTIVHRLIVYIIGAGILVSAVWVGVKWIERMQDKITTLQLEKTEAEVRAITSETKLTDLQDRLVREHDLRVTAEASIAVARVRAAEQVAVFNRHRFGELLQAKPGMMEKRINDATAALWAEIERESRP